MIFDLYENLHVAWAGVTANKVRSGLTMLGVVIGVATVISLLSIGQGARDAITGQISGAGSNLLIVVPGNLSNGSGRQTSGTAMTLTMDDAEALADPQRVPDAEIIAPQFNQRTQIIGAGNDIDAQVQGVTPQHATVSQLNVASGRFIEEKDIRAASNVAVLGKQVAAELFGAIDPLGQSVRAVIPGAGGRLVPLTVVGVLAKQDTSAVFGDTDAAVLVPISTVQNKIGNGRNAQGQSIATSILVVAADGRSSVAADEIDLVLRRQHKLAAKADADFSIVTQEDLLVLANTVTGTLTLFLGIIAVISLVVGGIGIMNIMLVSVTERTREIGLRKALGAKRSDIRTQFMLEAIVLSVLGGLGGILAGASVSWLVNASKVLSTSVSPGSVLLAFGFALAVGLASGVYPASRAARLTPIDALRYE